FIPLFALLFLKSISNASFGIAIPYSQGFGVAYQSPFSLLGLSETMSVNLSVTMNIFLPIVFIIIAIGVSGGAYVMRNMVWTEGIFVSNDFWRGIKQNAKQLILLYLIVSIFVYMSLISISLCEQMIVTKSGITWLLVIAKILSYIFLIFLFFIVLHATSMCVTYKLTFFALIKNSFLFTIGLLPQNIFFVILGGVPVILILFGGFFSFIGYALLIFFGVSIFMLVWTNYCQWAYDRFVNDKIGAKKNRGIYEKIKDSDSKSLKQYREQIALTGKSSLSSKPIKPITDDELKIAELPTSFNRADIEKLNESKKAIYDDNEKYIKEHENDIEFQSSEEDAEREKILKEREERIEKAKQELAKRNNNKKKKKK
ncbi:MAG: hypothetical protein KBS91_00145, partial [Firmicutes bacterium]|nr:hypothetical protein [Candidatus Caballimonas caccae]